VIGLSVIGLSVVGSLLGCSTGLQFKDAEVASQAFCLAPQSAEHSLIRWVGDGETTLSVALRDGTKELALEPFDVDIYAGGLLPESRETVQTDAAGRLSLDTAALPQTTGLWALVFFDPGEQEPIAELWLEALPEGQPAILCAGHLTEAGGLGIEQLPTEDIEVRAFTHGAAGLEVFWGLYAFEQGFVGGSSTLIQQTSAIVSPLEDARGLIAAPGSPPTGIDIYGEAWLVDQKSGDAVGRSLSFTPNWESGGTI
jgi:hypothetical protein